LKPSMKKAIIALIIAAANLTFEIIDHYEKKR
jgi:hypothetical protein